MSGDCLIFSRTLGREAAVIFAEKPTPFWGKLAREGKRAISSLLYSQGKGKN